jgi:hypothetical protein
MASSNNSFNRAQRLGALQQNPQVVRDSVSAADKVDFFSFRVTQRSSFQSNLRGLKSNADFVLFDRNRNRIAASRNSGRQSESINTILEQGQYFIKVDRRSGETRYRLRLAANSLAAPDPSTAKFVGLTSDNSLAFFNSDNLANVNRIGLTGLQSGENLLGIDFRPQTGQLFGLGSTNRLYSINLTTGAATQVGTQPFSVALSGTSFGFDFNPTVDRIRVVSDAGQNLRLNPDTGAVVDANTMTPDVQIDGNLNGATNSIAATAYTNSFAGTVPTTPPGATTQYGINTTTDELFIQTPPNNGTQIRVGGLGVDFSANAGFDIVSQPATSTAPATNTAFAVSNSSLYSINLTTGAATQIGEIRDIRTSLNLVGLAARA